METTQNTKSSEESGVPLTVIKANREMLELLADSSLPIAEDAQRAVALLNEQMDDQ